MRGGRKKKTVEKENKSNLRIKENDIWKRLSELNNEFREIKKIKNEKRTPKSV